MGCSSGPSNGTILEHALTKERIKSNIYFDFSLADAKLTKEEEANFGFKMECRYYDYQIKAKSKGNYLVEKANATAPYRVTESTHGPKHHDNPVEYFSLGDSVIPVSEKEKRSDRIVNELKTTPFKTRECEEPGFLGCSKYRSRLRNDTELAQTITLAKEHLEKEFTTRIEEGTEYTIKGQLSLCMNHGEKPKVWK